MRLTLSQVIPDVAEALNQNQNSARVLRYINRGQEELLNKARWVGTTIKYRVCTDSGFITWPRELATIEAMSTHGVPSILKNGWYEFLEYGADFRSQYAGGQWTDGWINLKQKVGVDQGEAIAFAQIPNTGNPMKLKVYARAAEASSARILLQFYDPSGNYIRTNDGANGWVDGEYVAINATTPATTINTVGSWVGVQKPITNDVVRITALDTVTNFETLLAVYAWNETNPSYRQTNIENLCPGVCSSTQVSGSGLSNPCPTSVCVVGKQRFIPAQQPTDYMMLQSISAIVAMSLSVYKRLNNQKTESVEYEQLATQILDDELASWIGYGAQQTPHFQYAYNAQQGQNNYI